jgi:4-amino-4-deoxy-L-arabinose transferase-like glycosyltransferase
MKSMLKKLWISFRKLDDFLDRHYVPLALILIVFIFRLPTFAEPYWYGDEAIYLTIGNALRAGEPLYMSIIDHKTPLIYYFAAASINQFGFRLLGLAAVAISTVAYYYLIRDFLAKRWIRWIALVFFILYTNLPRYEGNIPNGETFVMTFVLLALLAFRKTRLYQSFLQSSKDPESRSFLTTNTRNTCWLLLTGVLMGLATLTKVPAVFDFGLLFIVGWFVFTSRLSVRALYSTAFQLGIISTGWICMILLSMLYFATRGSLQQYFDFGLLYNFRYAGSWVPQFNSPIVAFFFTLKGKVILLTLWILFLTFFRKYLSKAFLFAGSWMGLALVAATLSNRPYPHYFQQVFPPLAMVIAVCVVLLVRAVKRCKHVKETGELYCEPNATHPIVEATGGFVIIAALLITLNLLHVSPYPTVKYYSLFFKLITKQISWETYRDRFDSKLADNYQVAKILLRSPDPEIFIWGNNPLLYAVTGKNPVGRFTVAFHIDDFKAYQETIDAIKERKPTYIVVMKEQPPLPGLTDYLMTEYIPNSEYPTLTVWRRSIR